MLSRLRADLLAEESADARRAWRVFEQHLSVGVRRRLAFRRMSKYVAAAVVVLAFLSAALWYALPRMDDERVAAIVPGSPKAMLQVEGGEEVEIFPDMTDVETHASAWTMRNEGGILRYDMPTRADSIRSQWHTLTVPRGGEYTVLLADGTKICVNSESRLRYPVVFAPADTVRRVYVSGEAYFQVARHETLPFEVCTAHGTVRVYGTKFNVRAYKGENCWVNLAEGSVEVSTEDGRRHVTMKPDDQVCYTTDHRLLVESGVDASASLAWMSGGLKLHGLTLREIANILERKYSVEIHVSPDLAGELFNCHFDSTITLQEALKLLSESGRFKYREKGNEIYFYNQ